MLNIQLYLPSVVVEIKFSRKVPSIHGVAILYSLHDAAHYTIRTVTLTFKIFPMLQVCVL